MMVRLSRDASGLRFVILAARFNHLISARLIEGCVALLCDRGAEPEDIDLVWVPGAFEIPLAARRLAETRRYHAVITLGSVIRGGTPHFDYVCRAVTDGVREVTTETGVPVAFGVLTTDDIAQAWDRVGGSHGNKGAEVALAAVEMARCLPELPTPRRKEPRRRAAGARS